MEWRLEQQQLKLFQNAHSGKFFTSPNSIKYKNISFKLLIYPNGAFAKDKGNVNIYLFADKPLTKNDTDLRFNVKCKELNVEWSEKIDINQHHNSKSHQLLNKMKTSQLFNIHRITFECNIDGNNNMHQTYSNRNNQDNINGDDKQWMDLKPIFVWEFNEHDINKLISTANAYYITSPDFMLDSYRYRIKAFPNGVSAYPGHFTLYLDFREIPHEIYSLQACISLFIPQTSTKYYKLYAFNKMRSLSFKTQRQDDKYQYNKDRDSCILLPAGYLPIQSLYNLKKLDINIHIEIRRIKFSNLSFSNFNPSYSSLGRMALCNNIKLSNKVSFDWKLSRQQLRQFKMTQFRSQFASDRYDSWYLVFAPNGNKEHNKGSAILSLCLLELPYHLGAITANIKLKCNDISWVDTAAFKFRKNGQESGYSSWPDNTLRFDAFCDMDNVKFSAEIDIIAMYDQFGYEINSDQYQRSIKLKTPKQDKKMILSEYEEKKEMEDDYTLGLGQQYETPGYLPDDIDDGRSDHLRMENKGRGNALMEKEMNELRQQIITLQDQLKILNNSNQMNSNQMNFKKWNMSDMNKMNNNNTTDHKQSFEKWWTNHIQLPQYYDIFVNAGYDSLVANSALTDEELKELGVDKKGHRIKILKCVQELF